MTKLPVCSGEQAIRVFERAGWTRVRQRGSHVSLVKVDPPSSSPCRFTGSSVPVCSGA